MNARQARFVAEYLVDLNATQAALRAGYSPNTAAKIGSENLQKPDIKRAIAEKQAESLADTGLSAKRVLEEYRRLAFQDIRGFFRDDGTLKPLSEWTEDQGSAVASMEVIIKNAEAGDGHMDRVHKFKLWDKTRALESLAKHFGLLVDKMEHSGEIVIRHEMAD